MSNYSTKVCICQDDELDKEITQKFTPKRQYAELLAASYQRLGEIRKYDRVMECGTFLEFRRPAAVASPLDDGVARGEAATGWKLQFANFCRDRLCPMCSWRRSYKIYGQVSRIMNVISSDYAFVFLTLTVPNCSGDELPGLIDKLQRGWHSLTNTKRFKGSVKGYFKVLEITRNKDIHSKSYGTYHPHYHVILAVNKSYFVDVSYIPHSEWLSMWRKAMKDDSIMEVFVERCTLEKCSDKVKKLRDLDMFDFKTIAKAVAEVAKYAVKSGDYIFPDKPELTDEVVSVLSRALRSRRLCSFGGCFEETRKLLNLDDIDDGDLVHLDDDELRPDVEYMIRRYGWSSGAYKLI